MERRFKVGDHVSWNSEAGRVSGRIIKIHTRDVDYKGHTHHASPDEPQYEIKSDKTDHIAMHKGSALRRLSRRERLYSSSIRQDRRGELSQAEVGRLLGLSRQGAAARDGRSG